LTSDLVHLAAGAKVPIARCTADHFLRDTLDLLSDSLDFLLGCLSAERWHQMPSLRIPIKQEPFRDPSTSFSASNSGGPAFRLSSQET
jgi:hypothetical protein